MFKNGIMNQEQTQKVRIKKEGGFKEAFHSLPHKLLPEARDKISELCFWNINTFNAMLKGTRKFRTYEIERIEEYFAQFNIDAWTGEYTNNWLTIRGPGEYVTP